MNSTVKTAREALTFVRTHGVVTMTRRGGRPSFVEAVAGGPIRGSWWGHPKGALIFALAESVAGSGDALALKLVDGKVTFVHKSLWPALARVVRDPAWRRPRIGALGRRARALLDEVERRGSLRLDPNRKAEGLELERLLLVHGAGVHTERGAHATELTAWRKVFDRTTLALSAKAKLDEALKSLGLGASVP